MTLFQDTPFKFHRAHVFGGGLGLARRALDIYNRACKACPEENRFVLDMKTIVRGAPRRSRLRSLDGELHTIVCDTGVATVR